ncbi:protocatechuate 3,4-dioxygenase subunit beta [Amycolatopsis thermalba]|uniref:protocatechuate 3,4-dioxygenase subunit beta n=1 Tax=Amycolatopsis thermalba TaxID=944492 RepID=UPI000E27FEF8|nr:protocatechuate 3,4-dioxygenase subunit beta [Amycolatopsis thermalba]
MAAPTSDKLILPRYRRDPEGTHAPLNSPGYRSTQLRYPKQPLVLLPQMLTEVTGPLLGPGLLGEFDNDLTRQHAEEPQGQRILVHGRLLDGDGRGIPNSLIEIWQANAGGRYRHIGDNWPAPLDPNFDGVGRTITDSEGRYEFTTIKPGAYPWKNHDNAWRPAHIHFSVFGQAFTQRLVTQMYFPDDPLFFQDPIFNSIPDEKARQRMISRFDYSRTTDHWALAFEFDIVVRGREQSVFENEEEEDE